MSKWKKITGLILVSSMMISMFTGCGKDEATTGNGETIVLRVLENDTAKKEGYLQELLDAFNEAYKQSKVNFVYEKKIEDNKRIFSNQLNGVSKAISGLADELEDKLECTEERFKEETQRIKIILKCIVDSYDEYRV